MTIELKDWLNSINLNKNNIIKEDPDTERKYAPFIINKCMSGHLDTVLLANEMNMNHSLPKSLQYDFFLNSVRKRRDSLLGCERTQSRILMWSNNTMVIVMKKPHKFYVF